MNAPVMQTSVENTTEQPQLPKSLNQSNEMIVIIRPSFMKFCQDGCRSAALNHILYWIAQKAKGQPLEAIRNGEVTWYASNDEIVTGLANAWGGCKVRQEVNSLIDATLVGRTTNRRWGADRTKYFFFGQEQCSTFIGLCKQHDINPLRIGLTSDVIHLIRETTSDKELTASIDDLHRKPTGGKRTATKLDMSYSEYLQSPGWKARRQKALKFANFRCQVCNSTEDLNVHHRTYERLGHEHMGDLITLCKNCHEIFHNNAELASGEKGN